MRMRHTFSQSCNTFGAFGASGTCDVFGAFVAFSTFGAFGACSLSFVALTRPLASFTFTFI